MGTCNFCCLKSIRKRAKKNNKKVTLLPNRDGFGGIDVYVYPKSINFNTLNEKEKIGYHACWFMGIGNHCTCEF